MRAAVLRRAGERGGRVERPRPEPGRRRGPGAGARRWASAAPTPTTTTTGASAASSCESPAGPRPRGLRRHRRGRRRVDPAGWGSASRSSRASRAAPASSAWPAATTSAPTCASTPRRRSTARSPSSSSSTSAFAHPVPDTVSDEAAALLEPLSVGVWACRKARVGAGLAGPGHRRRPIGLVAVQVARASGATSSSSSDVNPAPPRGGGASSARPHRRRRARSLAGDAGGRPEVLLECSGHPGRHAADGIRALAPAGRAVLVGMGGDELPLPLSVVQERELV